MGAEILLYGYGLVCLSMLVFNVPYGLHLRGGDRRLSQRTEALRRQVDGQLRQISQLANIQMPEVKGLLLAKLDEMKRKDTPAAGSVFCTVRGVAVRRGSRGQERQKGSERREKRENLCVPLR